MADSLAMLMVLPKQDATPLADTVQPWRPWLSAGHPSSMPAYYVPDAPNSLCHHYRSARRACIKGSQATAAALQQPKQQTKVLLKEIMSSSSKVSWLTHALCTCSATRSAKCE